MTTPTIDTHVHLVDDPGWVTADHLGQLKRTFTLDDFSGATRGTEPIAIVAVPAVPTVGETRRVLHLAAGSSVLRGVVGWVDLTAPDVGATITDLLTGPGGDRLRGVRHPVQKEPDPAWLLRPDVLRGLETLTEHGLVYELLVRPDQLAAAAEAATRIPDLVLVLDHGGNPPLTGGPVGPWEDGIGALAAHRQVICKISGQVVHSDPALVRPDDIAGAVGVLADAFGSTRLMFGSNYPFCTLTGTYGGALDTALTILADLGVDGTALDNAARDTYRL